MTPSNQSGWCEPSVSDGSSASSTRRFCASRRSSRPPSSARLPCVPVTSTRLRRSVVGPRQEDLARTRPRTRGTGRRCPRAPTGGAAGLEPRRDGARRTGHPAASRCRARASRGPRGPRLRTAPDRLASSVRRRPRRRAAAVASPTRQRRTSPTAPSRTSSVTRESAGACFQLCTVTSAALRSAESAGRPRSSSGASRAASRRGRAVPDDSADESSVACEDGGVQMSTKSSWSRSIASSSSTDSYQRASGKTAARASRRVRTDVDGGGDRRRRRGASSRAGVPARRRCRGR